jgi:glucokinase
MAGPYTIGIDLGGTNIKAAIVDDTGQIVQADSVDTQAERGFAHVTERIADLAKSLLERMPRGSVTSVGVGSPGPLSSKTGTIHRAPNLPGSDNAPLGPNLSERLGLPVSLENDANAAAYGEFLSGAAKQFESMVLLTLGTGIGGGVVLDGQLLRGCFESAGEVGHTIVVPNGRACPCGQRGCLERYASANAIGERLIEAVQSGESSLLESRIDARAKVSSHDVLNAREAGCELAGRIWDEACLYLAVAIVNLQHLLNPQVVVLAGGLINAGDELLRPVREHFDRHSWRIGNDRPEIVLATLHTDAGAIGAAGLAAAPQKGAG